MNRKIATRYEQLIVDFFLEEVASRAYVILDRSNMLRWTYKTSCGDTSSVLEAIMIEKGEGRDYETVVKSDETWSQLHAFVRQHFINIHTGRPTSFLIDTEQRIERAVFLLDAELKRDALNAIAARKQETPNEDRRRM